MKIGPKFLFPEPTETICFEGERTLFVDVDSTLVYMKYPEDCPSDELVSMTRFGFPRTIRFNKHHVEIIKEFRVRGIDVFVWSAGGSRWARAVCEAIGLDGIVNGVMGKPDWYLDDKDVKSWMGDRFFLDPNSGAEVDFDKERK